MLRLHRKTTRAVSQNLYWVLAAADLLHHRVDGIAVLHVELRGGRGERGGVVEVMSGESDSSNSFGRLVVFKFNIKRSLSRILYVLLRGHGYQPTYM